MQGNTTRHEMIPNIQERDDKIHKVTKHQDKKTHTHKMTTKTQETAQSQRQLKRHIRTQINTTCVDLMCSCSDTKMIRDTTKIYTNQHKDMNNYPQNVLCAK